MYKKSAGWEFTHPAELFCLIGIHGDHTGAEHLAENRRADRRAAAALLDHDDEGPVSIQFGGLALSKYDTNIKRRVSK